MAKTTGFETPQQRQLGEWADDVVALLTKLGGSFAELKASTQRDLLASTEQIAKLDNDFENVKKQYAERFHALADSARGGRLKHGFASDQDAVNFGRFAIAMYNKQLPLMPEGQRNAITPGTGELGGFLLIPTLISDIMRELDEAGVFLRNCPPIGVNSPTGGSPKGTSGATLYYPEYGATAPLSTPGIGSNQFALKRHVAVIEVDQWMLNSDLAIALAEYIRTEITYAVAAGTDLNWYTGDGTEPYCCKTGLLKLPPADVKHVTGDAGDDTSAKMIAKTTYYLAQMHGQLPTWGHRSDPRWYGHPSTLFQYLGVRDANGMPIASLYLAGNGLASNLFGYPYEWVPTMPSSAEASTAFLLLAALKRACRTYRHNRAVEFKMSDQLGKEAWIAGLSAFACDMPLDMVVRNGDGIVQLITHA